MHWKIDMPMRNGRGELLEERVYAYQEELLERFLRSPESHEIAEPGFWTACLLDYGLRYHGVTPAELDTPELEDIVFGLFPRQILCDPAQAGEIVAELRAFWKFLDREFGLPQVARCLNTLGKGAVTRLERELADPSNWCRTKAFLMQGEAAGFDVSTREGLEAWTLIYNASRVGQRLPTGSSDWLPAITLTAGPWSRRSRSAARKARRKMQKLSRRKNR
ncbi:MAG TPA: hypothetical protein VNO81_02180 [Candidatus Nitrosotenuis sp.]|nr:hypothetical protein [Candidatus Nitrosotenuis sp.]